METAKAKARREREGFFEKYVRSPVIDIGCGRVTGPTGSAHGTDPLTPDAMCWDQDDGDATFMRTADLWKHPQWKAEMHEGFGTVYASHVLEHIANPYLALLNWWRLVRPGGHLVIFVPSRRLYEKRTELPSKWNPDHKFFFEPGYTHLLPYSIGLAALINSAIRFGDGQIKYVMECSEGHTITDPDQHSDGEYSLESVIEKVA